MKPPGDAGSAPIDSTEEANTAIAQMRANIVLVLL